ncbi:cytochrome P450 family protein [Halococcus hamelinensis]|uniref:Cytochrome P450 n=1 Tax=Halococcus hamelinensis 100A6 TaxID=1132509 RepID=M0LVV8_9EURY|nr:cytochrome P450 [Halococcus hamelinensis]EMA37717.1 cytochrome P450 [Halococcus hamelinensis 100A6]
MRQEAPVHYDADREMWDVFRYADVQRVITEDETVSSDRIVPVSEPSETDVPEQLARNMLDIDPPEHDRLRGFVDERFRPRTIQEKRPLVEQAAADVLDTIEIDTSGAEATFDLVSEFAYPVPVTVIAALLDIPTTDREQFRQWMGSSSPFRTAHSSLYLAAGWFRCLLARHPSMPNDHTYIRISDYRGP